MDNIDLCPSHKVLSYDYVFPSRTNKQHMLISDLNILILFFANLQMWNVFQFFIILREWIYLLSSSIHKSCQKQVNYTKLIWFVSSPSPRWFHIDTSFIDTETRLVDQSYTSLVSKQRCRRAHYQDQLIT